MPLNSDIYRNFARIYDAEMEKFGFYEQWDRVFSRLKLRPGRAIDLACGTGTVALRLAALGWDVEGIDASEAMLEAARRRQGAEGVRWSTGDMRTFTAAGEAELVTCAFDSVNYLLTVAELRSAFARVAAHLRPGGTFLFDVLTPAGIRRSWSGGCRVRRGDGWFGVWESRFDRGVSHLDLTYFERKEGGDWARWCETHSERGWGDAEVRRTLRAAGLAPRDPWKKGASSRVFHMADR